MSFLDPDFPEPALEPPQTLAEDYQGMTTEVIHEQDAERSTSALWYGAEFFFLLLAIALLGGLLVLVVLFYFMRGRWGEGALSLLFLGVIGFSPLSRFIRRYGAVIRRAPRRIGALIVPRSTRPRYARKKASGIESSYDNGEALNCRTLSSTSILHLSDLHLTASPAHTTIEGHSSPNLAIEAFLTLHSEQVSTCDTIVITGDITDSGHQREWSEFMRIFGPWRERIVLVPGNHDLNLPNDPSAQLPSRGENLLSWARWHVRRIRKLGRLDIGDMVHRKLRLVRFLAALDFCQGTRAVVLSASDGKCRSLRAYLYEHELGLRRFAAMPPRRVVRVRNVNIPAAEGTQIDDVTAGDALEQLRLPESVFVNAFPMLVLLSDRVWLCVLNSIGNASSVLTNALGFVEPAQLDRLDQLLAVVQPESLVLALHHEILPGRPRQAALQLENASTVMHVIQRLRPLAVLNGHVHRGDVSETPDGVTWVTASAGIGAVMRLRIERSESGHAGIKVVPVIR